MACCGRSMLLSILLTVLVSSLMTCTLGECLSLHVPNSYHFEPSKCSEPKQFSLELADKLYQNLGCNARQKHQRLSDSLVLRLTPSKFIQPHVLKCATGTLNCEDLSKEECAFSVSSSGARCVLEKYIGNDHETHIECQVVNNLHIWLVRQEVVVYQILVVASFTSAP